MDCFRPQVEDYRSPGQSIGVVNVAVTGISGVVGQRLLARVGPRVGRIVGIDMQEPIHWIPNLEFHRADLARSELKVMLEGVDVVVQIDPDLGEEDMGASEVSATSSAGVRGLLDAAESVGVAKVVHVASAMVYGAWPTNAVPLTEDAPLRPNSGHRGAITSSEIARLLGEWCEDRSGVTVTSLRAAQLLGSGTHGALAALRGGQSLVRLRGVAPRLQFVHVDDLVAAIELAIFEDLPGVYNVAADGWISTSEAHELVGRKLVLRLPVAFVARVLRAGDGFAGCRRALASLPYCEFPWVVANDRLKAKGWSPTATNEELLVATPNTRRSRLAAGAAVATVIAATTAAVARYRRAH